MIYEYIIDLNANVCDVPNDVREVSVINVTDDNITKLNLPNTVTSLDIRGRLTHFVVPYHIDDLCCCDLGLKTIKLNDDLHPFHDIMGHHQIQGVMVVVILPCSFQSLGWAEPFS
jgi:hypothetical protein